MATAPKKGAKPVPAETSDNAAPSKSNSKLFIILGLAVVLLGGGGAGAWWFLGQQQHTNKAPQAKIEPPVFVNMDAFTVNLQNEGGGNDQFLQTTFTLQVGAQADVDNIKLYLPQVRSRILMLLSSKTAADLNSVEGKRKLGEEIISQTAKPFSPNAPAVKVNDVFFTSFVIQ